MTLDEPLIVAFGDFMLQVMHHDDLPQSDQRTTIIDWSCAELGGAVWNVSWYLRCFGRTIKVAGHYGADAAIASLTGAGAFIEGALARSTTTDRLLMFEPRGLPSIYLMEPLQDDEVDFLCDSLAAADVIVFAGTRHTNLRARYQQVTNALTPKLVIFSPSYSVYEYTTSELDHFLTGADVTFVNQHEAQHLCSRFSETDLNKVMRRSRLGGVVTRAAAGVSLYPRDGRQIDLPSTSGVTKNVVGAGEAFMCGFLEGFLQTGDFLRAGHLGVAVSAQAASDGRICAPIDPVRAMAAAGIA